MKTRKHMVRQVCELCGFEWSFEAGGYDPHLKTPSDWALFNAEKEARQCPRCRSARAMEKRKTMQENSSVKEVHYEPRPARFTLKKDVILAPRAKAQIDEALAKIRFHRKIYEEWDFKQVDPCGAGTLLNFYGKAGTGKTLAAEALAGTLGRNIISLGMADVESKFMGDTAKNIHAAFDSANRNGAVLFFDEADSLLGKRLSSVTQGIDNEVNSLRSTLLIELERFEGIAIFASNFAENYDKAFESRISQHVFFELPDMSGRRRLWKKHLLPTIPLVEERESLLSKLADNSEGFSGRNIRNCMRLALPKALLEAERAGSEPKLAWAHLEQAIEEIRRACRDVGTEVNRREPTEGNRHESAETLRLLGAKIRESQNQTEDR